MRIPLNPQLAQEVLTFDGSDVWFEVPDEALAELREWLVLLSTSEISRHYHISARGAIEWLDEVST